MRLAPFCLAAAATLAAIAAHFPAHAERTPPRALPLAESAASARVIVKFREASTTLRAHALSAGASSADVSSRLAARASTLGARHGLALRAGPAATDQVQVVMADGLTSAALAARLAADPEVEYAEPDRRVRRVAVPNDPFYATVSGAQGPAAGQWYLRAPDSTLVSAINAVTAWDIHTGNPSVIVAVIDTGVRLNHPDLAGKLVPGFDFVSDTGISNDSDGMDEDPSDPGDYLTSQEITANPTLWDGCEASDSSWHGTQVSGIVAASTHNGVGMAGTGRHVRVLPVRALGKCFGYTSDIVNAMRWSAGLSVPGVPTNPTPAKVLNLSLGSSGACSQLEADTVAAVNAVGAVVVAAAGNSAGRASGSPANCGGAIGVAGLRHAGSKVGFSDIGPELSIAAPGGNCVNLSGSCLYPILTTTNAGTQGPGSHTYSDASNASVGTSFSAPLVSGVAALMLSARPNLTPAQLRSLMMSSARPFPSSGLSDSSNLPLQACQAPGNFDQGECYCTQATCGAGMVDANAAVRAALGVTNLLQPAVALQTASPQAGTSVVLTGGGSLIPSGLSIVARRWSLVQAGGIVPSFDGASDGETVSMTPSAAGRAVVQLALTDDRGLVTAVDFAFDVAAAAPGSGGGSGSSGGGGGGGSLSWAWLLGLAVATLALMATRRASARAQRAAQRVK
jgi:serine protease